MEKLYQSAQSGNLNVVKLALKRNFNINTPNPQNWTLLHFACIGGQQEIVQYLIEKEANLNAKTSDGVTPLHLAAQVGNEFLISILIEAGALVDLKDILILNLQHSTNILTTDIVNRLLEYGADPNQIFIPKNTKKSGAKNPEYWAPLHIVCQYGNIEIAKILLDHQAKVDIQNNYGATPLHILAQHSMSDLITLMIDNGADRNSLDKDQETPLTLAVKARNVENVDRLITEENINKPNIHLDTALHIACKNGFSEIVDLLILHNADIHMKNEDGNAPIHIATIYKQKECVEILIDNGADFLELNGRHKSAFALSTGEITTYMKKLLERSHKMNQNLKLRHADYVSIAKSKNQKASSRMSFRSNSSQNLNSRTQSKLSSRTTSKLSNRPQQISTQKQEKSDDKASVHSKVSKASASTTKRSVQQETRKPDENAVYLDNYAESIRYIIDSAQSNFDKQINEVKEEIDILINDLKKHEFIDQNYDTNNEVLEKTDQ